jgi:hypothetical protein
MEIEDIAKLDLYLRSKNGRQHLLDTDSLIIADNDAQAVNKLKDAAYRLNELDSSVVPEEIKQTWQNLFTKQVRYSVSRAKNKRKGASDNS